jgi:large subunit ribosomal protein L24
MKNLIKKGNKVLIITGNDKGKQGEVIAVDRPNSRVIVKDINMVKKHTKPTKEKKGGIFPKESYIHISNIKLVDGDKKKEAKK